MAPPNLSVQLQDLQLEYCQQLTPSLLSAALSTLPSLTSLGLSEAGLHSREDISTALDALQGQVTQLRWSCLGPAVPRVPQFLTSSAEISKLRRLQRLVLDGFTLNDDGLRALMTYCPILRHLQIDSCKLQVSHAEHPAACRWLELKVSKSISIKSLAHLPLTDIQNLFVEHLTVCVEAADSSAAEPASSQHTQPGRLSTEYDVSLAAGKLSAALAAEPACSFGCHGRLTLECPVHEMPDLLPLLARWQGVESLYLQANGMRRWPWLETLTPAAIGALGALLTMLPSCTALSLGGVKPHAETSLLPALVHTSITHIFLRYVHMTEAKLRLWCSGVQAGCRVTVNLEASCTFYGRIGRLREALAAAGNGVQLVFDGVLEDMQQQP